VLKHTDGSGNGVEPACRKPCGEVGGAGSVLLLARLFVAAEDSYSCFVFLSCVIKV